MSSTATDEHALTAHNRSVDVDGARLVYRRFGNAERAAPPLLCLQHFRGNLDNWDPALIDRIAREREIMLLDNRGVGASSGVVPDNVDDMARDVLRFVDTLGLRQIDVLGFSLDGYIAQALALVRPRLIRRLVLAGTAPRGAPKIHRWSDDVYALAAQDVLDPKRFIRLFFSGSQQSRTKSAFPRERLIVTNRLTLPRGTLNSTRSRWAIPEPAKLARPAAITVPVFVANGDNDLMMITENSYLLAHHLPNAQLRIYSDAGHGFLDQYPEQFADHVNAFLGGN